jgi:hypothetical protein
MPLPSNFVSSVAASSAPDNSSLTIDSASNLRGDLPDDPAGKHGTHSGTDTRDTGVAHPSSNWLRRADLFLRVIVRLYVGLILVFLPWTRVWEFNRFFLYYAHVSRLMESGAVRGVVSGLGLLNLWIAISEAMHHKEG